MINPTINDIGRRIVTFAKWRDQLLPAYGVLVSFDDEAVFVRYGESDDFTLLREDADWADAELAPPIAPDGADDLSHVKDDQTLFLPFSRR